MSLSLAPAFRHFAGRAAAQLILSPAGAARILGSRSCDGLTPPFASSRARGYIPAKLE